MAKAPLYANKVPSKSDGRCNDERSAVLFTYIYIDYIYYCFLAFFEIEASEVVAQHSVHPGIEIFP